MAKRKRLSPARPGAHPPAEPATGRGLLASAPPIAQVAADSSTAAALAEVSGALEAARDEGRLIQALPLAAVEDDYLMRDRMVADPEEMAALKASLAARGQQTPIEVVALPSGRYGLISGWRRVRALRDLLAEGGPDTVLALLRRPDTAADAYAAMVEENEIRVGLSYYERARVVVRAVEAGVFADEPAALKGLFATASRAKRSKIGSFTGLYRQLDRHLRFPAVLTERQGLALAKRLDQEPAALARLKDRLRKLDAADASAEQAALARFLSPGGAAQPAPAPAPKPAVRRTGPPPDPKGAEVAPGVFLSGLSSPDGGEIVLAGPGVDTAFVDQLRTWMGGR